MTGYIDLFRLAVLPVKVLTGKDLSNAVGKVRLRLSLPTFSVSVSSYVPLVLAPLFYLFYRATAIAPMRPAAAIAAATKPVSRGLAFLLAEVAPVVDEEPVPDPAPALLVAVDPLPPAMLDVQMPPVGTRFAKLESDGQAATALSNCETSGKTTDRTEPS